MMMDKLTNQEENNFSKEYMPIVKALQDKHALDIILIDLRQVSGFADAFIVATARSEINASALMDAATEALDGMKISYKVEGAESSRWKLIDAGAVLIHIFSKSGREFYDLERLWGDAPTFRFESEE
jgi:ribosome-associated protein